MISKEKFIKNEFSVYILDNIKKYQVLFKNSIFPLALDKKDINIFSSIIKALSKNKLLCIKYLSKDNSKSKKNFKKYKSSNIFFKKQILLFFIYLYEFYNDRKLLVDSFKIILYKLKNNFIIDNNDILEIILHNIIFCLIKIINSENIMKSNLFSVFYILIDYLVQIITTETSEFADNIIFQIFDSIYQLLIKSQKLLFIFKNADNYNQINKNISIIKINEAKNSFYFNNNKDKEEIIKIKNKINDILYLIYGFNINRNYTNYLLFNFQKCFTLLNIKNYSKQKIIDSLSKTYNQISTLNDIILYEEKILSEKNKDPCMPKRYFLFNKSIKKGLNYNYKTVLTGNNFTFIFSFKQIESVENVVYPLFTMTNEKDIIFGIYLYNKKAYVYFKNDYEEESEEVNDQINVNKIYLVIVEYHKKKNDLVVVNINGIEKIINLGKIKNKQNTIVNAGYIPENINKKNKYKDSNNFIGIIGTILFFNKVFDNKDFINNIFNLSGSYDILIYLNSNSFVFNDIYNQEINSLKDEIKKYFINNSKLFEGNILFNLSPISFFNDFEITNSNYFNDYKNYNFIDNFYNKNNNKENNFISDPSLDISLHFIEGPYPVCIKSSVFDFIQNDGFHIITLNIEYFYNILKMLISLNAKNENDNNDSSSIYYHINKSICPIFDLIYNIIKQYSNCISFYKDSIDTMGFSIMKVFKILAHKTPLNEELLSNLINFFNNIHSVYMKAKHKDSKNTILNFLNKLLTLIYNKKYFDINNYKLLNNYLKIFKIVLKKNEYLIDENILDSLFNFTYILDKSNFDKINEYKELSHSYKNLLKLFISQINTMKLLCAYIQKVFENKENNILIKYKLIKLYYYHNNVKYVYNQNDEKDTKEKINKFFNLFKRKKDNKIYDILLKEKLFKEYKKYFGNLVNNYKTKEEEENKKYLELIKSIFIQLIYEQSVLIIPSKLDINYLEPNILLSDIQISFFKTDDFLAKKNINKITKNFNKREFHSFAIDDNTELVYENLSDANQTDNNNEPNIDSKRLSQNRKIEKQQIEDRMTYEFNEYNDLGVNNNEKLNSNNEKIYGLFDELIIYDYDESLKDNIEISWYIFKSLFGCFYDNWNKENKLKFIKNNDDNTYESINMCFNDFNRFKQKLFFQFIQLFGLINNHEICEKIIKLVFSFIKQTITVYESNQKEINARRIYIHIFENKKIMEFLLNLNFNDNDNDNKLVKNNQIKGYIETVIANIINSIIVFHPNPFIFSYIKKCIKNNNKYVIKIIKNICDFIISKLKNNDNFINNNNHISICFYYFNRIKFICSIKKAFQKFQNNAQALLCEEDYNLFLSIISLIEEYSKSYIIFDPKRYTYNSKNLVNIYNKNVEEKKNDKKYIKAIIQSPDTKIINNDGLFISLIELSLHIIYLLRKGDFLNRMKSDEFYKKFLQLFIIKVKNEEHFISYYIDLNNKFFSYSQPKKHENLKGEMPPNIKEIYEKKSLELKPEYKKFLRGNLDIDDNRIQSAVILLLVMNYQVKITNYDSILNTFNFNNKNNQMSLNNKEKDEFDKLIRIVFKDFISIYNILNKIQEDEKIKLFSLKELKDTKINVTKSLYLNNYKYLLETIKKNKINFVSDVLINEMKKRFIKELETQEENNNKISNLIEKENKTPEQSPNQNIKDILLSSPNNEDNKNEKKINPNQNNYLPNDDWELCENFSQIDRTNLNKDCLINGKDNNLIIINENDILKEEEEFIFSNYFTDAKYQILCTKRDLVLKELGYFFYKDYFNDQNFITLKKKFKCLFPPGEEKNNYNHFEKQMSLNFPSTTKNYSNWKYYYPKLFFRPDKHFFNNKFYKIGHNYFKASDEKLKLNFEFGHGLLNQTNFNLFEINEDNNNGNGKDKNNENKNVIIDEENNKNNHSDNLKVDDYNNLYEIELLSSNNNVQGNIILKEKIIVFQTNMKFDLENYKKVSKYVICSKGEEMCQIPKQIIIPYGYIEQIIKRKFIFFNQAAEIFLINGKSYFFNFYKEKICDNFFEAIEKIKSKKAKVYKFEIIQKPHDYFKNKKYTLDWSEKKISTLEYLLLINKYSGRSYNDLTQYLVFPWMLKDYSDINDKKNLRDFSLAMAIQEKANLEVIQNLYEYDDDEHKSHFKCHYSNSSYVSIYLFRINPFTNNQIKLQNNKFDAPHRQVSCLQEVCNVFRDHKETCELIPEYFYLIEAFLNMNYNFFGFLNKKKKDIVNNLRLTNGFDSLLELILFHQNFINSDEISANINNWIDIIFGVNQYTDKKNVVNSFPFECYEQNMKNKIDEQIKALEENKNKENIDIIKEIDNIKSNLLMTYLVGICPSVLFKDSYHLKYSGKTLENNYNKLLMKNEVKNLDYKGFIYMNENNPKSNAKFENNNIYIITNKEILVYTKQMKSISNLLINNIKCIYPFFEDNIIKNKTNDNDDDNDNLNNMKKNNNILYYKQYIYKRLIFEIGNCKFFFIGGYMDNSFKIYFRDKDKSICYNYITNSVVTCMKFMNDSKLFLTGHLNGQISKWNIYVNSQNIKCKEISKIIAHKSGVSLIEIHYKLKLLLSASDNDGIIFIRKLFGYELLSIIKYNNLKKQILDINFDKEYFIITYNYKKLNNKNIIQKIITYSVNGIKLSSINIENEDNNEDTSNCSILPITMTNNNDEIFMLSKNKINLIKITGKNRSELIPIDENKLKMINKGESIELVIRTKSDFIDKFKGKLKNSIIISYFYDFHNHLLFCLFSNGQMYRVNLYKKNSGNNDVNKI